MEKKAALHETAMILGSAPALLVHHGSAESAADHGTVLLVHGLGGSKEVQRTEARSLAQMGYLAIVIDAIGHGDRRYSDWDERFAPPNAQRSYFDIVRRTAEEIPAVLEAIRAHGWRKSGRLGACGISMGGAILFGAMLPRGTFDAVATIVASPRWLDAPESPHLRIDAFFPTPLLIQTAGADTVVPPDAARVLHTALVPHYATSPDRLRYIEYPGEPHLPHAPAWNRIWSEVLAWFATYLRGKE